MYELSKAERKYVERLLKTAPNEATRIEVMGALDESAFRDLIQHLGVVEFYKDVRDEGHYSAPYGDIGKRYWKKVKAQLYDLICGSSRVYAKERRELKSQGTNTVIILVPMIMAALGLPAPATGVAILLALTVAKIGIRSFCEEFKPAALASTPKHGNPGRSKSN